MNKGFIYMNLIKIMMLMLTLLCGCALFQFKEDSIYSQDETIILEKTTNALDYGYGYDSEIELNYIFSYSFSDRDFKKKEKNFKKIVNEIDIDSLKRFYEKIYRIHAMMDYKLKKYKEAEDWKNHTHIKNELFPPLEKYIMLLQKYLIQRDPSLKEILNEKKKTIIQDVEKKLY